MILAIRLVWSWPLGHNCTIWRYSYIFVSTRVRCVCVCVCVNFAGALDAIHRDSAALMLRSGALLVAMLASPNGGSSATSSSQLETQSLAKASSTQEMKDVPLNTTIDGSLSETLIESLLGAAYTLFHDNLKWDNDSGNTRAFLSLLLSQYFFTTVSNLSFRLNECWIPCFSPAWQSELPAPLSLTVWMHSLI